MKQKALYWMIVLSVMMFSAISNFMNAQDFSGQHYHARINHYYNNHWSLKQPVFVPQSVTHRIDSNAYGYSRLFFQIEYAGPPKTKAQFKIHSVLNSKFLLPYQPTAPENANIIFTYKSENLKYINLVVSFFDENENTVLSDTIFAPDNNEWSTCSKEMSIKGCRYFHLELLAEGIDSTYSQTFFRMGNIDSICPQNLWIDEIDIELDGRSLRYFYEKNILPDCEINAQEIIPLENETSFNLIPELKEKKIIAFGESQSGTEAMTELFVQIAKYAVKHEQCRLILFDYDMGMTLFLNSFIQGNESFDLDSLLYENRYITHSYHQLKDLLLFLKDHNRTAEKKVFLMGIDFYPWIIPNYSAAKYLYTINQSHNYKRIYKICYDLITKFNNIDYKTDFRAFEKDIWFLEMLSESELKLFFLCFQSYYKLPQYVFISDDLSSRRDYWLFENAKTLIDFIYNEDKDSKVLIYGNNYLFNYKAHISGNSFGQYMRDYYGNQYSNIGFIVNEGYCFTTNYEYKYAIFPLFQHGKSIESALSNFSHDCIYVPEKSITSPHICIRNRNNFMIITPSNRFDALIYKRHTYAAIMWPGIIDTQYNPAALMNQTSSNLYEKLLKKIDPPVVSPNN